MRTGNVGRKRGREGMKKRKGNGKDREGRKKEGRMDIGKGYGREGWMDG